MSTSSSRPGRPPKNTSTISSKLYSQNGSLMLLGVEHLRLGSETAAVFVVHVEKKHAQIRPCGEDQMHEQRHRARFADASGAKHREMLAQHFIDIEAGRDRRILVKLPDLDHS